MITQIALARDFTRHRSKPSLTSPAAPPPSPPAPTGYARKAQAEYLLKKYADAESTCRAGLELDATYALLRAQLQMLRDAGHRTGILSYRYAAIYVYVLCECVRACVCMYVTFISPCSCICMCVVCLCTRARVCVCI